MNGLLFYWLSWILWIIVTFFMHKNKYRTMMAIWLLLLIICSNYYISIHPFVMSLSYLVIFIGALILHTRISRLVYHMFVSVTVMIGYTAILIWENLTPLEHFLSPTLIQSCSVLILIALTTKGLWSGLACGLFGIAGGELTYSIIIANYTTAGVIGDKHFLDLIMLIVISVVCFDSVLKLKQKAANRFRNAIAKSKPLFGKQAQ